MQLHTIIDYELDIMILATGDLPQMAKWFQKNNSLGMLQFAMKATTHLVQ